MTENQIARTLANRVLLGAIDSIGENSMILHHLAKHVKRLLRDNAKLQTACKTLIVSGCGGDVWDKRLKGGNRPSPGPVNSRPGRWD